MYKFVGQANNGMMVFLDVASFLQVVLSLWKKHIPYIGSHYYPYYRISDVFQFASQLWKHDF